MLGKWPEHVTVVNQEFQNENFNIQVAFWLLYSLQQALHELRYVVVACFLPRGTEELLHFV